MKVLVDTNIFIDYGEKERYAIAFFDKIFKENIEVHVLPDVYMEAKTISPFFFRIRNLLAELNKYSLGFRIEMTPEERDKARTLKYKCIRLGKPLDTADVRIITVSKTRSLLIYTRDRELKEVAKVEGTRCYTE